MQYGREGLNQSILSQKEQNFYIVINQWRNSWFVPLSFFLAAKAYNG